MAFTLTNKQREYRYPFAGDGVALILRGFTDKERRAYQLALAKISGRKKFGEALEKLWAQVAEALIVRWEGIVDDDGQPVPVNPETVAAFVADPEARKYWYRAVNRYLSPQIEDDPALTDEEGDPDFLPER